MTLSNYSLKDEIREYWSARSETFDHSAGHGMRTDKEVEEWARLLRMHFGDTPVQNVLELASGTGQVTSVLLSMGLRVSGIDLCEPMIAKATEKHKGANGRVKFYLGDAENTMMGDGEFDAVVSRHLVWTLLDPEAAFKDWIRVLKPGGVVVVIDGDWVSGLEHWTARLKRFIVDVWDKLDGTKPHYDRDAHESIVSRVYFNKGLRLERAMEMLGEAGFTDMRHNKLGSIWREQCKAMTLKERIGLGIWYGHYFMLSARKPEGHVAIA